MKTYKDKVSGETLYVVSDQGITRYYKDKAMRIRHRLDGPAILTDGYKSWYANDKLHRLDGPAIEGEDAGKAWYVDGVIITLIYSNGKYEGPESLQDALSIIKSK
jgi:hypothetical protein